jgi:hypothetical protein
MLEKVIIANRIEDVGPNVAEVADRQSLGFDLHRSGRVFVSHGGDHSVEEGKAEKRRILEPWLRIQAPEH